MGTTDGLTKRVERLEHALPATDCRTCADRPVFTLDGTAAPCPERGRAPHVFTIDIDAASGRGDGAA